MTRRVLIGWLGVFSLCLPSCSGQSDHGVPLYPTSGQVLVNGEPAQGVRVAFHPVPGTGENPGASATTDANGKFVLEAFPRTDGAPAGDYKVSLFWPATVDRMLIVQAKPKRDKLPGDKLQGKFANPDTSGITAHVDKGKNVLKPFELQATVLDDKAIEDALRAERRKMRGK